MSRYALGDPAAASRYLQEFLGYYDQDDGWVRNAESVLAEIGSR